jgi:hypothetical protein
MSFNCWYTLLALSVEGAGRVSKSDATTATFWLALGKVVCGIPSWLMVTVMALAQAPVSSGGSLHPLRGLASVQFGHLGIEGCLLIG